MDYAKAVGLFFLTFASEDLATVSGGLLAAGGTVSLPLAFLAVFLGIWVGDFGIYAIARVAGPPVLARKWFQKLVPPSRIAASEAWFREKGWVAIAFSRFMPGTRVAVYASAGLLRMSMITFLAISGVAAFLWVAAIFFLLHWFGRAFVEWFEMSHGHWGVYLGAGVVVLLLLWALKRSSRPWGNLQLRRSLARWGHWEFWPAWLFYAPVIPRYLALAFRHGGLTVPASANPGIPLGGFIGESKFDTLSRLMVTAPEWTAPAALIPSGTASERLRQLHAGMERLGLGFPVVLKPDVGQRGAGVRMVEDREAAEQFVTALDAPLVVQQFIPGPLEAGIFYCRFPGQAEGKLFALTRKEFPTVVGDGRSPLRELILRDRRASLIAATYFRRFGASIDQVPAEGTRIRLVQAGNHAQGCIFRDGSDWATPELARSIDRISQALEGFYFGRYDVRFSSEADLRAGRGFSILELNGASAEATSIYDPQTPLVQAYRVLFEQWRLAFEIGAANLERGARGVPASDLLGEWLNTLRWERSYPQAD